MPLNQRIDSLTGIDPSSIPNDVLNSKQPLVLKGLLADWPLVKAGLESKQCAFNYVNQYYNGQSVTACLLAPSEQGRMFYNETLDGFNFKPVRGNFSELVAELFKHQSKNSHLDVDDKTPAFYMGSTNIDHWFPAFRQHNDLALNEQNPLASIWIGNQTRVAAHYDFPNNIACCAVGNRRFTLFPPDQLENLYVGPIDFTPAGQAISLVDFENPDYQQFPKFKIALEHAQIAELEPGDALFIPSMWWHHVEAQSDFNVLVNYWWRNTPEYLGSPFTALQQAILALRDLPEEQRAHWKHLLDYYVFDADKQDLSHIPDGALGILSMLNEQQANQLKKTIVDDLK